MTITTTERGLVSDKGIGRRPSLTRRMTTRDHVPDRGNGRIGQVVDITNTRGLHTVEVRVGRRPTTRTDTTTTTVNITRIVIVGNRENGRNLRKTIGKTGMPITHEKVGPEMCSPIEEVRL